MSTYATPSSLTAADVRRASGTRERRFTAARPELRDGESGAGARVRGYAALFNSPAEMFDFDEVVEPGAFSTVLADDVRALFNHDANLILARTKSGTLRIGTDHRGLWYEFEMPDTSFGRDLVVSMRRGDVDQSSFAFHVSKDRWSSVDGHPRRHIQTVSRLFDVSPVTYPAYPATSVGLREHHGRGGASISILRARLNLAATE